MRYGHQSFFDIVGRHPIRDPMTPIEQAILSRALQELWDGEVEKKDPLDPRSPND